MPECTITAYSRRDRARLDRTRRDETHRTRLLVRQRSHRRRHRLESRIPYRDRADQAVHRAFAHSAPLATASDARRPFVESP